MGGRSRGRPDRCAFDGGIDARAESSAELAGDRRPIVAHEGRFEHAPLRAGDPLPKTR